MIFPGPGDGAVRRDDRRFIEQALALAARSDATSPNPRVGCVLVRDGRVVGTGFHRRAGGDHAEAGAVAAAGDAARGATAYVNLEPCSHTGQTPPCADLLIAAGVVRVVASLRDPDPRVDGRGFARLRAAAVEVLIGPGHAAAERLNAPFLCRHRRGRPLVSLKAAVSLDGLLAAREGCSRWISGEEARRFAHRLRMRHDAVLVGAGTVRADDPRLTARLPRVPRQPLRVVISSSLDLDPGLAIFRGGEAGRTCVYTCAPVRELGPGAEVVRVAGHGEAVDLRAVLDDLATRGAQSVLVEGGGRTFAGFLAAGLADRAYLFTASRFLGAGGATPLVAQESVAEPAAGFRLVAPRRIAMGDDLLVWGDLAAGGR